MIRINFLGGWGGGGRGGGCIHFGVNDLLHGLQRVGDIIYLVLRSRCFYYVVVHVHRSWSHLCNTKCLFRTVGALGEPYPFHKSRFQRKFYNHLSAMLRSLQEMMIY